MENCIMIDQFKKRVSPNIVFIIILLAILLSLQGCRIPCCESRSYLVLYAFDAEGRLLAGQMEQIDSVNVLGRPVLKGRLAGEEVILAESGIGMTNAAMTTQRLIDKYHPKAVIFSGIAGAIDSSVHIGDIVVCERWITHDYVYHGADGPQPRGIGAYSPHEDSVLKLGSFPADSVMLRVAGEIRIDSLAFRTIGNRKPSVIIGGVGVSGNAFIDNREKRTWLADSFDALVTDMETAAVAQVCYVNDIPFIGFRSASDLAGGSGSLSARAELDLFFEVAAENSSALVIIFLQSL
ncbi:MAG: 5'-methylthioadenosine/S-adenosylhomocysteine nucleosidase [candidate division Zixibacteria bacterium]